VNVSSFASLRWLPVACALVVPPAVAAALVPLRTSFPNTDAALVLVVAVLAIGIMADRVAGVLASASSALWFDFFLTRPYYRFSITHRSDLETAVLLLVIGVVVTELAVRGRDARASASRRADYLRGIQAAAAALSAGTLTSAPSVQVTDQLIRLLDLEACRFQPGVAGLGNPARLEPDGRVVLPSGHLATADRLPAGTQTELLVQNAGLLQGRFLMTPRPGTAPDLEQRLVAVALADQMGALVAAASGRRTA
jgi:K+-sensing histidine kinase KdpD